MNDPLRMHRAALASSYAGLQDRRCHLRLVPEQSLLDEAASVCPSMAVQICTRLRNWADRAIPPAQRIDGAVFYYSLGVLCGSEA